MAFTAKELTGHLKELKRTQDSLDQMLDFVSLVEKENDKFDDDLLAPGEKIKNTSDQVMEAIREYNDIFNKELNKIPLDEYEIKDAAEKLKLYHGDDMQVFIWAEQQKVNFEKDSYWWRYWEGIVANLDLKQNAQKV